MIHVFIMKSRYQGNTRFGLKRLALTKIWAVGYNEIKKRSDVFRRHLRRYFMQLTMAPVGEVRTVCGMWLNDDLRKRLEDLGFTYNSKICVFSKSFGSLIVGIQNTKVALSEDLARKIMVWYQTYDGKRQCRYFSGSPEELSALPFLHEKRKSGYNKVHA